MTGAVAVVVMALGLVGVLRAVAIVSTGGRGASRRPRAPLGCTPPR
jgi:hypothetical protein